MSDSSQPYIMCLLPASGKSITAMAMFLWKNSRKKEKNLKVVLIVKVGQRTTRYIWHIVEQIQDLV